LGNLGTTNSGSTITGGGRINAGGAIVGYAAKYVAGSNVGDRAVRWDASSTVATELGNLGTNSSGVATSFASDINDVGIAVGYAEKYDSHGNYFGYRAVMWAQDGIAIDLNNLIDPASGWTLTEALSITNDGWIAGDASFDPDGIGPLPAYNRLFLIHVPEPSSIALIALAWLLKRPRRSDSI
jgi:hypothetical protein